MAPTLRRVVAITSLRLRVLAGGDELDRPVRWVAVSELEDPTPFLEGGELVLTTGMRLDAPAARPYISRLVAKGVAGLGIGVGLSHDRVPEDFVRAAADHGLPLIEIDRDTPFIAIGKAVSELLAAEQYEELRQAFAAQGRLTRAALQSEGAAAVVDRLAKEINGWAVLFDDKGGVVHVAGDGARGRAGDLVPELKRLRATAPASLALSTPDEHVIVQPLGDHRRVRGFFAVGARRAFSPVAHTVVNAAGSLLTLSLEQGREQLAAEARLRTAVLRLLLAGEWSAAREVLGRELPAHPIVVLACRSDDPQGLLEALPGLAAPWRDAVVALVTGSEAEQAITTAGEHGRVGVSAPIAADPGTGIAGNGAAGSAAAYATAAHDLPAHDAAALATALDQAQRALASADPIMRFPDLAGQGLLSLLDPAAAAAYSGVLLAPLREQGARAELIESLRAYLAANGHWDAAAQRLGVHRHTLRYRMRKAEQLLGRDLDDPAVRAELWIALNV